MAKLAPELTPRIPGSASGLRVSVCIRAPARLQRATAQQSGKRAGQSGVEHDDAVGALAGAGERINDNGRGQRLRADQQAECSRKAQEQ